MKPSTLALCWSLLAFDVAAGQEPTDEVRASPETGGILELSLEDAVRIVLERNLDLEIESLNTEIARYRYAGLWGAFDPVYRLRGEYFDSEIEAENITQGGAGFVIDAESRASQQNLTFPLLTGGDFDVQYRIENQETSNPDIDASLSTSTDAVLTFSLTQPLLRGAWGRYATSNQRIAEFDYGKQVEEERRVRQDLLLRVHESYWNLVQAIEQVSVRELTLELGNEQLDQDRRRLQVGVGTEVDVLQAETNVATNEEQLLLARVEAEAAMDTLKSLLFGRDEDMDWGSYLADWETPIVPLTPLPEVEREDPLEWTRSLGRALDRRTELVVQRLELEAQSLRLARTESETLPGLDLSLTAANRGFDPRYGDAIDESFTTDFPTYTAALSFDFPLFNRQASYARRSARVGLRSARILYDRIEQDVVADVRARVRDVNYQAKAVQAAKKSLELARRQLQAEQARYEEGLSTTFQVLEFQEDLAQALSAEKAARSAYAKAQAALQRAEGWLGENRDR